MWIVSKLFTFQRQKFYFFLICALKFLSDFSFVDTDGVAAMEKLTFWIVKSSLETVVSQTTTFILASRILQTRSVVYLDSIDTKNGVIGCAARRWRVFVSFNFN